MPIALLPASEYAQRRQQFLAQLPSGCIALLPAASETRRNRDTHHPFRQDSDFYYLTGFPEPDALAVFTPGAEIEYRLFVRPRDPELETWTGRRAGPAGAVERYGAEQAFTLAQLDEQLLKLMAGREVVYYPLGEQLDQQVLGWLAQLRAQVRQGVRAPRVLRDITHVLHPLRLYKRTAEVEVMRRAGQITAAAHCRAMRYTRPGCYEYQVEAEIAHEFTQHGSGWAYPSIVGGGDNATILHYVENNALLRDGDLLLIDAGCELDGYASDITRTFPVNGRFSAEQRALYDIVLAAQQAALSKVKPEQPFNAYHDAAVAVLCQGLLDLGLLSGSLEQALEQQSYRRFYMHRTGHWLGMDVHDVGDYREADGQPVCLQPGMVLTVEPGLYVAQGLDGVDPRWQGIGIRIEDDALVTADGHEILTEGVPREAAQIEALMRG